MQWYRMFSYTKLYYREDVKKVGRGWEGKEFIHILHKAFYTFADKNRKRFLVHSVGYCALTSTPWPNFVIFVDAVGSYENDKSPFKSWDNFKTDSSFTIVAKLFSTYENSYFVKNEVREECPKFWCILYINI